MGDERAFEEALAELEALVRRLEQGELPLEESLAAFERGMALVRQLGTRLDDVAQRVEVLLRAADGALATRPLPDTGPTMRSDPSPCAAIWRDAAGSSSARSRAASRRAAPTLRRAIRYSLLGGGKRLRPILALAAGEVAGGRRSARCCPSPARSSWSTPTRSSTTISRPWTTTISAAAGRPATRSSARASPSWSATRSSPRHSG